MLPTGYASFPRVLSVSQVARYLKELLEIDDILQDIWVQGEVSDCKTYPSGHCYFTLKDGSSQLLCVFFKHARLRSSATASSPSGKEPYFCASSNPKPVWPPKASSRTNASVPCRRSPP